MTSVCVISCDSVTVTTVLLKIVVIVERPLEVTVLVMAAGGETLLVAGLSGVLLAGLDEETVAVDPDSVTTTMAEVLINGAEGETTVM